MVTFNLKFICFNITDRYSELEILTLVFQIWILLMNRRFLLFFYQRSIRKESTRFWQREIRFNSTRRVYSLSSYHRLVIPIFNIGGNFDSIHDWLLIVRTFWWHVLIKFHTRSINFWNYVRKLHRRCIGKWHLAI